MNIIEVFENTNRVKIEIRLGILRTTKSHDLGMTLVAHEEGKEIGDQPSLASVSVTCSAMNQATLEACLIHALYVLDFQIALAEFDAVPKKTESLPPHFS